MPLGGKGPTTIIVLVVETVIAGLCVGGRYYTRRILKNAAGIDDVALIASWIFMLAFTIAFTISSIYGFGQHVSDLGKEDIKNATLVELCGQFMVAIAMGLSKTGVALFLMRIINTKWQKFILWGWIITIMFLSVFLAVSCFAQCYPVQSLWDTDVKVQYCALNLTNIAFVMCSFSAAMDFFLALCPYYVLKDLNMKPKEKWTIIVSLSLGVFAGVLGIVRTSGLSVLAQTSDYLYATADSVMYTSSELTLTLICVSLPIFRPLIKRLASSDLSSNRTYAKQSTGADADVGTSSRFRSSKNRSKSRPDLEYAMGNVTIAGAGNTKAGDEDGLDTIWKDNDSDRSILPKGQGITRKQEFAVSYNETDGHSQQ
ncbi:hypothetical protein BJ170DRAFT_693472 [Xylariales sp. AK1849]|nr:hypothetical protein BJ170DRAFT_693472 [Xylariales sp. AK1849]